ncbi:extracellular endo-alpha-(1-_5)-L-arabinanase 1 [Echinicola pacifica]|uniref:Extracellular endo-alpha-(1->5)-L-arabinanase 1 n=2 Tax=Echinicola pacifica TaxID=346377 RepID=A0A918PW14_9BACT|nr:extracellular endo-alpha-(1->5)-L-arabinanase 1 [Echinicola pacifica]
MTMKYPLLFFASLLLMIGSSAAQEISVHDPVMAREGEQYYLFSTGKGIAIWTSTDMKSWTRQAPVFAQAPRWAAEVVPDFGNHIWAPDIFYFKDQYYLYYSISSFAKNTSAIGLATSKTLNQASPEYGWTDHGIILQSVPGRDMWNAIDPNIILDEEGAAWMSFGSFWGGIKLVRLSEDLLSVRNGPEDWFTIARRPRTFELNERAPGDAAVEAPFIFKKNNFYYLFISFDLCCRGAESTYKIMVGRSEKIQGPYLDKEGNNLYNGGGSLLLEGNEDWFGLGHNSAYHFEGKDYLIFHGYDAHEGGKPKLLSRQIQWDDAGWPSIVY